MWNGLAMIGVSLAAALLLPAAAEDVFHDLVPQSGIAFVLENSATARKHQIETMVGGVALLDYDSDGRLDIFFTNGARQPSLEKEEPRYSNRLYRNLGQWRFEDVTARAGLAGQGYSIGAAAADFDNDGHTDLFVASVNRNLLYRNKGDGTFQEVTAKAGLRSPNTQPWSVAAAWFDYDNDGWLDLFIVNYVKWDPATEPFCGDIQAGLRTYCHPKYYQGLPNRLFRNRGDGTFEDVSGQTGIARHTGKGMGVAFADFDGDGWLDVFVANDTTPNFLFRNLANGTFQEMAMASGTGLNDDGRALSSMGVDFRDVDNDGKPDLFVTALANETFPLFRNLGGALFSDVTYPARIGRATLAYSGWGNGIFDFDNDGRKDLFAANGDVNDNTEQFSSRKSRQSNLLLWNRGREGFVAQPISAPGMHRGAAFGDLDGDGRMDAVVTRIGEKPLLLNNRAGRGNHWIGFRLRGTNSNRDAIGAQVLITTPSGLSQVNHVTTSVGYASSSQTAIHFGVGREKRISLAEIRWPGGKIQRLENLTANRYWDVTEPEVP
jgi:hypothetical protein